MEEAEQAWCTAVNVEDWKTGNVVGVDMSLLSIQIGIGAEDGEDMIGNEVIV